MGGAERNARRKRQAQTASRQAPVTERRTADRRKMIIGAVAVVVLLGAVLGGVIYTNNQKDATEDQAIAISAGGGGSFPVRRDGAVVVAGDEDTAKVTLDVYEDFLCPACGAFEDGYGGKIEEHVQDGTLAVRYHMLPMLNDRSDPPGYSLDSANAALCVADTGKFPQFHRSLFEAQPEEGSRGWDNQQLIRLGKDLGVTEGSFESCVESGEHHSLLETNFEQVRTTPYLQQDFGGGQKGFGTPTLAVGEKIVETTDPQWLDSLLSAG